jgi:diguanylate cyclase (GGDEF)-like protein
LQRTARGAGEQISLALANLRLQETLRSLSIRDPLTGVFNRRFMEASLERELARARRAGHSLGVLMIDIDHFKLFNDTHGHEAGDVLLAGFAELLRRSFREEDIVCRYGGEEFLVLLPGSSSDQTVARALSVCEAVRSFEPYHQRRPLGRISVSVGVASFPEDGSSDEALVRAADAALYRAKHEGRDRVVVARDMLPLQAAPQPAG